MHVQYSVAEESCLCASAEAAEALSYARCASVACSRHLWVSVRPLDAAATGVKSHQT